MFDPKPTATAVASRRTLTVPSEAIPAITPAVAHHALTRLAAESWWNTIAPEVYPDPTAESEARAAVEAWLTAVALGLDATEAARNVLASVG